MPTVLLFSIAAAASLSCSTPEPAPPAKAPIPALYDRAMQLVARSQLDSARALFAEIVRRDSSEYTALLGLAEISMRKRQLDQAIPFLQRAIRLDTLRVDAPYQLAQVYRMMRRDDEARRLLKLIVERFPTFTPACMAYADVLMTDAPPSPKGALEQYEAILKVDPEMVKAKAGAAASRLRLGQFERAERDFEELLQEAPDDLHLPFLLATTRHWQRDYIGAIEAYKRAIDVLPPASPQRPVRLWNLRLAYLAAHGSYPGDLAPTHIISPAHGQHKSPVHFTDVARENGVDKTDRGRGVAWADFDGDNDLDLFTVGISTPHGLFMRDSDRFAPTAERSALDDHIGGWAAIAADFDGDGDSDLYVTRDAWEGAAVNSLYENDGHARFTDIAAAAGTEDGDDSFTAAWGDVDGDGWLDLYVADGVTGSGAPNKLYINSGGGRFRERAASFGVDDAGKSLGVAFGDYDNDGDLDLYVANVAGANRLYRNDGGRFADIAERAGVGAPVNGSYVPLFFDSDGDGDLDIFVSAMAYYEDFVASATSAAGVYRSRAHLYRNDGKDRFTERATDAGLARAFGSMGAGYSDLDGDGQIDIYLANGGPIMARFEPNALFLAREGGYVDVASDAGVANQGKGHGVAFADYDGDGDVDLYAGLGGHYPGDLWPNSLYRNEGTPNRWLSVHLKGRPPNTSAIGAQAVVFSDARTLRGEVQSGGGFGSTSSFALEFGLGAQQAIDSLHIFWPSGRSERHGPLQTNHIVRFSEAD